MSLYLGDTKIANGGGEDPNIYKTPVIDSLNSNSSISALSANQGKILNEKIGNLIKVTSVTGTTNGAGYMYSNKTLDQAILLRCWVANTNNVMIMPYIYNNQWWMFCANIKWVSLNSQQLTVTFAYIDNIF